MFLSAPWRKGRTTSQTSTKTMPFPSATSRLVRVWRAASSAMLLKMFGTSSKRGEVTGHKRSESEQSPSKLRSQHQCFDWFCCCVEGCRGVCVDHNIIKTSTDSKRSLLCRGHSTGAWLLICSRHILLIVTMTRSLCLTRTFVKRRSAQLGRAAGTGKAIHLLAHLLL